MLLHRYRSWAQSELLRICIREMKISIPDLGFHGVTCGLFLCAWDSVVRREATTDKLCLQIQGPWGLRVQWLARV
jgi:hypothetical protein